MKRRSRELSIFNLSALDVLATATGVFVLLVVMLMPYYRKSFDANAEIEDATVGGDFVTHRGRMMESVLLSVLEAPALARARRNLNSQGLN